MQKKYIQKNGFTLVEVLVSVALFSIVMVVALGSLVALSSAVKRAEALDTATNNLAAALDNMSRAIRTGTTYHCGLGGLWSTPQDCATSAGGSAFTYQDSDTPSSQITYCLSDGAPGSSTCNSSTSCTSGSCTILRKKGMGPYVPLTSPEVNVKTLQFIVRGAPPGDALQPAVTMLLVGTIALNPGVTSTFQLETSVTQHVYDQ